MSHARLRRRRVALVLGVATLAGVWAGPVAGARGSRQVIPVAQSRYLVREGDTLWAIARRFSPEADPRRVVDAIAAANTLDAGHLVPGQTLVIPLGG